MFLLDSSDSSRDRRFRRVTKFSHKHKKKEVISISALTLSRETAVAVLERFMEHGPRTLYGDTPVLELLPQAAQLCGTTASEVSRSHRAARNVTQPRDRLFILTPTGGLNKRR